MRTRSIAFLVRMNTDEIESLAKRVKRSGLSREEYVRRTLFAERTANKPEGTKNENA